VVVRVRVKLKPLKGKSKKAIETSALANSGFASIVPEAVIPAKLARQLGFLPKLPEGARTETYVSVAGTTRMQYIPNALEITVSTTDREAGPVIVGATISRNESEVLLSDKLMDELKIQILRPGAGLWRFSDDKPEVIRETTQAQEW